MSSLNEQLEKTATLLKNVKLALEEQGINTTNLSPNNYPDAIRSIVNDITVENVGLIPVLVFKYNENRPNTPDGGSWDSETGEVFTPEGWFTDIDQDYKASNKLLPLWMSTAVFSSEGNIYKKWSTPVRISGKDGENGERGPAGLDGTVAGVTQYFNTPIFFRGTSSRPDTPKANYDPLKKELTISTGWTETINVEDTDKYVYWQSYVKYNTINNPTAICTSPIRMSAESSIAKGNIRWYKLSNNRNAPAKGGSGWTEWQNDADIAPTRALPYLYCYDETIYSESNKLTSPVYLLTVYTEGLLDINVTYAVGQENTVRKGENESEGEYEQRFGKFWFASSVDAISIHKTDGPGQHPDDLDHTYYPGLTEKTQFLWCRETFVYADRTEDFYRVISYYKAAEKAPILYSAGVYNDMVLYTKNEEQCPYVFYPTGLYLDENENVLTKEKDGKDVPMADEDAPQNGKKYQYFFLKNSYEEKYDSFFDAYQGSRWKKIDSFEAIYSDIGIFKSALVGKFVFDDKYMFSQFGKNDIGRTGVSYTEYTDAVGKVYDYESRQEKDRIGVAAAIEDPNANKTFVPSALINAVTGESWFANGTTKFYYDGEGDLADGAIAWRFEEDENGKKKDNPTLYIDGNVKIGTKAPEHKYGVPVEIVEVPKSFNELITDVYDDSGIVNQKFVTLSEGVEESIKGLNKKLDGKVEYWFYNYNPSESNYPLKNWIELDVREDHQGDVFVNKSNKKVWIFGDLNQDGTGELGWNEITDQQTVNMYVEMALLGDAVDGQIKAVFAENTLPDVSGYNDGDICILDKTMEDGSDVTINYVLKDGEWTATTTELEQQLNKEIVAIDKQITNLSSTIEEWNNNHDNVINQYFGNVDIDDWDGDDGWIGDNNAMLNHIGDTYTNINTGKSWTWYTVDPINVYTSSENTISSVATTSGLPIIFLNQSLKYSHIEFYIDNSLVISEPYTSGAKQISTNGITINITAIGTTTLLCDSSYLDRYYEFRAYYLDPTIHEVESDGTTMYLKWTPVVDEDVVTALAEASKAVSAIDGKVSYYTSKPTSWSIGDMWKLSEDMLDENGSVHFKKDVKVIANADQTGTPTTSDYVTKWELLENNRSDRNLLSNSSELILQAGTNANKYKVFGFPLTVSTGDVFTFKCEGSSLIEGTATQYAVRILSPDLKTSYSDNVVEIGDNKWQTIKVTAANVSNEHCVFLLYPGGVNATSGNTIKFSNFSLVKGMVPLAIWEDYQGDNDLKNLVDKCDSSYLELVKSNIVIAELNVNAGEEYVFMAEKAEVDDTGFNIGFRDSTTNKWLNSPMSLAFIPTANYTWYILKVVNTDGSNSISNRKVSVMLYSGQTPTNYQSKTLKLTNFSLVKGTRPMMKWKSSMESDMSALTRTFGTVSEIDGVSLSKAVAVKNSGGSVVGILNGGTEYKASDDTPIVFATGVNKSTQSTLANKVADARFIVYDTGSVSIGGGGHNTSPTYFDYSGSGRLADGNIVWNAAGGLGIGAAAPSTGVTIGGNVTIKGKLEGATGTFKGELSAVSGSFTSLSLTGSNDCTLNINSSGLYSFSKVRGTANIGAGCSGAMLALIGPGGAGQCKKPDSSDPLIYADNGAKECATFYGKSRFSIKDNSSPIIIEKRTHDDLGQTISSLTYTPLYCGGLHWITSDTTINLDNYGFLPGLTVFVGCSNGAKVTTTTTKGSSMGASLNGSIYSRTSEKNAKIIIQYNGTSWQWCTFA